MHKQDVHGLVVFKLGGSSVSSIGSLQHFSQKLATCDDRPVLVVVSALSKVTDSLEAFCQCLRDNDPDQCLPMLTNLRARHLNMITQVFPPQQAADVALALVDVIKELEDVLDSLPRGAAFEARHRDQLLRFGEAMSSVIVSQFLNWKNRKTVLVDARDVLKTNNEFGSAEPLEHETRLHLDEVLIPLLNDGNIVVTQGFCGSTIHGATTTLGRGGSDFSATYLGALLNATEIEIRTDTKGILSADPRKVVNAYTIRKISHERASALAHFGAKVLHQRCIEPVIGTQIPVRVSSSFDPHDPGTLICAENCTKGFSVTSCRGWLKVLVCPQYLDSRAFSASLRAVPKTPGFLAMNVDPQEARIAFSKQPDESHLSEIIKDSATGWETTFVFVMTTRLEPEITQELCDTLREMEIVVSTAFIDPDRGGIVLAISSGDAQTACLLIHRKMLKLCDVHQPEEVLAPS